MHIIGWAATIGAFVFLIGLVVLLIGPPPAERRKVVDAIYKFD